MAGGFPNEYVLMNEIESGAFDNIDPVFYAYLAGIGIMAGGFPNEYVLMNEIESGAFDNIDPVFYAYLAGIVVMTILCSIVQFKMHKKQKEAEEHPYAKLN